MMKNKITTLLMAATVMMTAACTESHSGPTVTPPSWKGFNYVVKKASTSEQITRGDIEPGDEIRVFAVRKIQGKLIGQILGIIYIRYTAQTTNEAYLSEVLDKQVTSIPNTTLDGWEDPYATFTLPTLDGECLYYKVEAACAFEFNAHGNEYSNVDYSDQTSHEDPYLGSIYTNLTDFVPGIGGEASSAPGGDGLKYHTLYESN